MGMLEKEWEEIWESYVRETIVPLDASDTRIAEVEKSLGPDIGLMMQIVGRSTNQHLKECHFPMVDPTFRICGKKGIKAHSISRSAFLDVLTTKDHLMHMQETKLPMAEAKGGHTIRSEWDSIGKSEASVFTGICAEHDNNIFKLIDDKSSDLNSEEYKFLLAFRAVIKFHWEYYDALYFLRKINLQERKPDLIPYEETAALHKRRCENMLQKWFISWNRRNKGGLKNIIHRTYEWEQKLPSVVFSKVIGMGSVEHPKIWTPTYEEEIFFVLTVLPYADKVRATISIHGGRDYAHLRQRIPELLADGEENRTRDIISSAMVANSNSLYLSKEYFETISEEQKFWMITVRERFRQLEGLPALGDAFYNLLE